MNKLLFILLLLAITAYAQQERVAIINTIDDRDSISVSELTYLTDKLRETAVKILPAERFGVMTTESIVAFLGSQERLVKVCNESSCLAELGRQVSADYVAQGRIGRFGNDLTIRVELYNVNSGVLMDSFTGDSKNIYGLRDIINENAADLFKKISSKSNVSSVFPLFPPQQEPQQVQYQPPPQPSANTEQRAKIQRLIDKGFAENKVEIKREALSLSYVDKTALYNENKKTDAAFGYAALNTIPFGVGSYMQGDIKSGVILSIADVVGWGFFSASKTRYSGSADEDRTYFLSIFVLGSARIAGWIFPFVHQNKQNKEFNKSLDEVLYDNNNVSLSIDPLIVPRDGTPAVGLAFNVRY